MTNCIISTSGWEVNIQEQLFLVQLLCISLLLLLDLQVWVLKGIRYKRLPGHGASIQCGLQGACEGVNKWWKHLGCFLRVACPLARVRDFQNYNDVRTLARIFLSLPLLALLATFPVLTTFLLPSQPHSFMMPFEVMQFC